MAGTCTITVFFQDPFWVGLYERSSEDGYEVCKLTFGAEPKDYEVYALLLSRWRELAFSPVQTGEKGSEPARQNPKRERREIRKLQSRAPLGTKAQQALKLQRQEGKEARRAKSKAEKEAEVERKFQLRQEKRKEKHRGH